MDFGCSKCSERYETRVPYCPGCFPDGAIRAMSGCRSRRRDRRRANPGGADALGRPQERFDAAQTEVEHIPMGQPILVGHHAEKRHRRDLSRHDRKMRAAVDLAQAAERAAWAAKRAGRSISSDDPEAIEALSAQLAQLEPVQALARAINKALRSGGWEAVEKVPGMTKGQLLAARTTLEVAPWMKVPMDLKSSGANIRRIKKRIAELEAAAERVSSPIVHEGFTITGDPDENRVRFEFDRRPDKETARRMKQAGFRFSRTHGVCQRHLNSSGIRAAHRGSKELFGWDPTSDITEQETHDSSPANASAAHGDAGASRSDVASYSESAEGES